MRMASVARCAALCGAMALIPASVAAIPKNARPGAQETPTAATPAADAPMEVTYLGGTYALLPDCYGTVFVVGVTQAPGGTSDLLLTAIPYPGGVTVLPPKSVMATGVLADKVLNDAVCLKLGT